ncbi:carbon-nitrogen hydrolase family protein [Colwellia sp. D2M02]|uniref:carbon-nitrogen hydrolase family protein n=1 Tax=Colwellia sp. D2M02 TaxID=2841562 RepID=UPI002090333B|nr:carbon-nitrogen hydrolase family protein [Colwellia sp. D2M02]
MVNTSTMQEQPNSQVLLSAIQLSSCADVEINLQSIAKQLSQLTEQQLASDSQNHQHIVVLPECCLLFGAKDSEQLNLAQKTADNQYLHQQLAKLAKQFQVYLVAGTIPILGSQNDKFTNSSCVFSPLGEQLGRYDKIHLFDVEVTDNTQSYCESRYTQAGAINYSNISIVKTPLVNIGLTVCFDLRFPQLFQKLSQQGANVITVPSAFTQVTGEAHWQTLLQARAIENQVYIIAAGQEGTHENGRKTWGHSMIISPWGDILTCLAQGEGFISAVYDPAHLADIRQRMPLKSPLSK